MEEKASVNDFGRRVASAEKYGFKSSQKQITRICFW